MAYQRQVFVHGAPMTLSASRMQTWLACNRKAGWTYIAEYGDDGTDATDFGGEVHKALELFKRDGVPLNMMTDVGAVAAEAVPYVEHFRGASEGGNARFEGEFTLQGRHLWRGAIDLSQPGEVNDYKTTSDFKWAKSPRDLLHDPQAVLYAMKEFERWSGPTVKLTWLYLRKKRPYKALPVTVEMPRVHAVRAFAALELLADDFQRAALNAPADPAERHRYVLETLQPNLEHCTAYGGCPHRSRCPSSPFFANPSNVSTGKKPMDLLAQLEAMDAAFVNGAPPAPVHTEAPPMLGVPVPTFIAPPPIAPPALVPKGTTTFSPAFLMQDDDAPPPPANAGAGQAPNIQAEIERLQRMQVAIAAAQGGTNVSAPLATASVPAGAEGINPPKRGRGRPRKDAATVPGAASPTMVGVPVLGGFTPPTAPAEPTPALFVAPAPATIPAPPPVEALIAPDANRARIGTLYVGCRPSSGKALDFTALVAEAKVTIGPAVYYAGYGYKANGMLLQMIDQIIQHRRPAAVVVPDPAAQEATICMSLLYSLADNVVEALR